MTVSRGNMFVVPDLRGRPPSQAETQLTTAGWERGTVTTVPRNVPLGSSDDGKILDQTPLPGTLGTQGRRGHDHRRTGQSPPVGRAVRPLAAPDGVTGW